jgi:prepilin-type N-terminal cleavage/methylation domain-containing protein
MRVRQQRRAFTLMEIVLTMAIMVMIVAIGYPSFEALSSGIKVEGASDAVRGAWAEAQAHAVNEGRAYRFAVIPNKGNFRIAPDSSDYWGGSVPAPDDPDNAPLVLERALPKGMIFTGDGSTASAGGDDTVLAEGDSGSGQWVTTVVFLPDGTVSDDVDLTLRYENARPITLHLRALTGVVTAQRGEE